MARMVHCIKLGREAEGLDFPPYPGELGKRIYENVSKEAWAQWVKHQTMLVNENRLSLADPRARKYLADRELKTADQFLGLLTFLVGHCRSPSDVSGSSPSSSASVSAR